MMDAKARAANPESLLQYRYWDEMVGTAHPHHWDVFIGVWREALHEGIVDASELVFKVDKEYPPTGWPAAKVLQFIRDFN
jgi:hypothetical protein